MSMRAGVAYQQGDIIFLHGKTWLADAIQWATRARGEAPTYANHVAIITTAGDLYGGQLTEADVRVRNTPLTQYATSDVQVWRMKGLADDVRAQLAAVALSQLGDFYGVDKLALQLGDGLLGKLTGGNPRVFRRLSCLSDLPICSLVGAKPYHDVLSYDFGLPYTSITPDGMCDWVGAHPVDWERVS